MLFDPLEEDFDLPAAAIEFSDGQRRHGEIVGQEDQDIAGIGIAIANAAERNGIIMLAFSPASVTAWSKRSPVALSTGRE